MSEDKTIRGETTMTWSDQARLSARTIIRFMLIFSVVEAVVFFVIWAMSSSDREWLRLRHDPLSALGLFAKDAWPIFVSCFVLLLMLLIGLFSWCFHRLPDANRRISYEASEDSLVTRDAANFALTVPWSMVIRVRNNDQLLHMQLAPGGWRTVFWRAFAPEDREPILRWAQRIATEKKQPRP
jgi:hypothetical protein